MSSNVKTSRRGEFIFKEGEKISSLILIQSGAANLTVIRPKKNIDVIALTPSQITGELGFLGAATHNFSLVAGGEVKYMEIPIEVAKAQIEAAPQFLKMVIKSLTDRLKAALTELRSSRMEKDQMPCPDDQVAKVFGSLFHAVRYKGKAEDEKNPHLITIDWVQLKQYAQRVFGESPRRLEQSCNLAVKLKFATYGMGKAIDDPNGPDEIQQVIFSDLAALEAFFEFYQYYYFKNGADSILKYDEGCMTLLTNFLKLMENAPVDRFGAATIEFPKAVEFFKTEASINLANGHFAQLESKGLFAKRHSRSDGTVTLSFDIKEWQTYVKIWKILSEVEKWNERGFVDMNEEEAKPKKKNGGGPSCPSCSAEVSNTAKFCPECGSKLEAKAAA